MVTWEHRCRSDHPWSNIVYPIYRVHRQGVLQTLVVAAFDNFLKSAYVAAKRPA